MQTLRVAWRNLWRNKRRTAITAAAIALNTAILITGDGLMAGMLQSSVNNTTNIVIGEAQVHAPKYRAKRSFYDAIEKPEPILAAAERAGIGAAPRSFGVGLASAGKKSAGAQFWGIDVTAERKAFTLVEQVAKGKFLAEGKRPRDGEGDPIREAVIGRKLARSLDAEVGSELVAVVQSADGSIGNELFKVIGVLKTITDDIDRSAVMLRRPDFVELFSSKLVHEIALNSRGGKTPETVVAAIKPAAPKMEVLSWRKLAPAIAEWVEMSGASMAIFGMIFFLSAGLGVLNSMLMATYERMREFGVIKALGGTPWRIVRDVSAEAFMLGLSAGAIGAVIGLGGMYYLHVVGIDLSSFGNLSYSGIAFDPIWRSTLSARSVVSPALTMLIVTVLATLYPAIKAARINPVRAMTQV